MRKGFSLLEVVMAIIVVAISISALPRIVSKAQSANEFSIRQELVFHAKSMTDRILSNVWDSQFYETYCTTFKVPKEPAGCGNGDSTNTKLGIYNIMANGESNTLKRLGIIQGSGLYANSSRKFSPTEVYLPTPKANFKRVSFGPNSMELSVGAARKVIKLNDIDDYDGYEIKPIFSQMNEGDFVTEANLSVDVDYVNDTLLVGNFVDSKEIEIEFGNTNASVSSTPTNIKRVRVKVADSKNSYAVELNSYAMNIGNVGEVAVRRAVAP